MLPIIDLNFIDPSGQRLDYIALCLATHNGNVSMVKLLLGKLYPLISPIFQVSYEVTLYLQQVSYLGHNLMYYVVSSGKCEMVQFFEKLLPFPSYMVYQALISYGFNDLSDCCHGVRFIPENSLGSDFLEMIKYIIDHHGQTEMPDLSIPDSVSGQDLSNSIGESALSSQSDYCLAEAIYHGHTQLVKLLLSYPQFNPMRGNQHDNFILPASFGYFKIVKMLIEDSRTDLSKPFTIEWPTCQLKMDEKICCTLGDAILYVAKHEKKEGFNEFVNYLGTLGVIDISPITVENSGAPINDVSF